MLMNSIPIDMVTAKTVKTSDEFLELPYEVDRETKAIKFVKKAIALDEN